MNVTTSPARTAWIPTRPRTDGAPEDDAAELGADPMPRMDTAIWKESRFSHQTMDPEIAVEPDPPERESPVRSEDPVQLDGRRAVVMLLRAFRRRCPNCGGGPLFRRWLLIRDSCPRCHLKLDRGESDYFLGSYTVNFVGAELFVVLTALVAILVTWPDVPWKTIEYGLYVLVVPFPVLTYPFSKTVWLAVDLWFRPLRLTDLEGHGENVTRQDLFHRSGSGDRS